MSKNYYDHLDPIPRANVEFAEEIVPVNQGEGNDDNEEEDHKEVSTPRSGKVPVDRKKTINKRERNRN